MDSHLSPIGMSEVLAGSGRLPPLRNYHLLPGSPLIDAGLDLRAEFGIDVGRHDVSGMPIPQGRAFDIGAIEAPGEMERRGAASQGKRPETRANPTNGRR